MYKALRYIKINGNFVNKGETVDLSTLSVQEIARLEKKGIVEKTNEKPNVEETLIEDAEKVDEDERKVIEDDESGDMTAEEVRSELLEKITHTVAVKELKLLAADFKANASLETLVDLIMENEEYENHFLDYIEHNGL